MGIIDDIFCYFKSRTTLSSRLKYQGDCPNRSVLRKRIIPQFSKDYLPFEDTHYEQYSYQLCFVRNVSMILRKDETLTK